MLPQLQVTAAARTHVLGVHPAGGLCRPASALQRNRPVTLLPLLLQVVAVYQVVPPGAPIPRGCVLEPLSVFSRGQPDKVTVSLCCCCSLYHYYIG